VPLFIGVNTSPEEFCKQ